MIQCPLCGYEIEEEAAKFCMRCGANLTKSHRELNLYPEKTQRRPPSYRPSFVIVGSIVLIGIVAIAVMLTTSFLLTPPFGPGIKITSDSDFLKYNPTGTGTQEDPYIFANYDFKRELRAFTIQDTTKHFMIINCTIDMCLEAIRIENVAPGTVKIWGNTIFHQDCNVPEVGASAGIIIKSSPGTRISNNIIINTGVEGIIIENSRECHVSNNSISEVMEGIYIDHSDSLTIANNSIKYCHDAVECWESHHVKIIQNIFEDNYYSCIEVDSSNHMLISKNYCFNITNTYLPSSRMGIWIRSCDNCTISNNTIVYCQQGMDIYSLSNSSVVYNRIENNSHIGIIFDSDWSQSNTLYLNSFIGNNYTGTAQVWDNGISNTWYHSELKLGNYWADWNGTGFYSISGSANAIDMYPLSEPPV